MKPVKGVSSARYEALIESYKKAIRDYERKTPGCYEIVVLRQKIEIARMEYRIKKQKYELYLKLKENAYLE